MDDNKPRDVVRFESRFPNEYFWGSPDWVGGEQIELAVARLCARTADLLQQIEALKARVAELEQKSE